MAFFYAIRREIESGYFVNSMIVWRNSLNTINFWVAKTLDKVH